MKPVWQRMGEFAWRKQLDSGVDHAQVLRRLLTHPHVQDVVVTEQHVMVVGLDEHEVEQLQLSRENDELQSATREHTIEVEYTGEDLEWVSASSGMLVSDVIAAHTATVYRVEMLGFMPGFAYLGTLDPRIRLPRRSIPRTRVPAGSVAIAGARTAVYPFASPGGWHLIGVAKEFVSFDPAQGATLQHGDKVRFVSVLRK